MLRYLGYGGRQFGVQPMYVHKRSNWEFFAVLKGRCSLMLSSGEASPLHTRHLWVFSPDTAHGWSGVGTASCQVAVFHFSSVPHLIEQAVAVSGRYEISLTPEQVRLIGHMAAEMSPHYVRVTEKSHLVFERALIDLSLIMLDTLPDDRSESKPDFAVRKVEAGITWYLEHMTQQPKIKTWPRRSTFPSDIYAECFTM